MKIGTVVNLRIDGDIRSCVILNKITYHDLYDMWTNDMKYLREYNSYDDLYASQFQILPVNLSGYDQDPIYQLLYGDKKVWIRGDTLKMHGKKI